MRLRHLLQYLNTTRVFGLLYLFPQKEKAIGLSEFTVFSDSSFAPAEKGSQSGCTILLSYGGVRHLVHWHSTREKKIAEGSAEAELYALSTAFKAGQNVRLLVHELLTTEILLNLRCDNKAVKAAIAMMDEPSWRTRYISIYGESLRQELLAKSSVLTFASTEHQLADPLTKPTAPKINESLLPQLGLNHFAMHRLLSGENMEAILYALHSAAIHLRVQAKVLNSSATRLLSDRRR